MRPRSARPPSTRRARSPRRRCLHVAAPAGERGLLGFVAELADAHRERDATFCADISPLALERLGEGFDGLGRGATWPMLIDFGFTPEEIRRIARPRMPHRGEREHGDRVVPRRARGHGSGVAQLLSPARDRHRHGVLRPPERVVRRAAESRVRVPSGETALRAPLHLGRPRSRSIVIARVAQLSAPASDRARCRDRLRRGHRAGGASRMDRPPRAHRRGDGAPVGPRPGGGLLRGAAWRLRVEDSAASFRLEETRGSVAPDAARNADRRAAGSLQMDSTASAATAARST
jgi:hypothetical protein